MEKVTMGNTINAHRISMWKPYIRLSFVRPSR